MRAAGRRSAVRVTAIVVLLAALSPMPAARADAVRVGEIARETCADDVSSEGLRVRRIRLVGDREVDLATVPPGPGWRRTTEPDLGLVQTTPCAAPLSIDVESEWAAVDLATGNEPALVELAGDRRWVEPRTTTRVEVGERTPRHAWRAPGSATHLRSLASAPAYRSTADGRITVRFDELFDLDPFPGLRATRLDGDTTVVFPDVFVPREAILTLGLASERPQHVRVTVTASIAGERPSSKTAESRITSGKLDRLSLPLGTSRSGRGTVEIRLSPQETTPTPLRLVDPELRGVEPVGPPRAKRPNVILFTLDTVRADHLSIYGYHRPTTPFLETIADESLIFERAYSQVPSTRPSHFSLLSSRYPRDLGIWTNSDAPLPQSELTLAEVLRSAGWRTGAVSSVRFLVSDGGSTQGFDEVSTPPRSKQSQLGKHTTEKAIDFVRGSAAEPFFLWVHYFDAHLPYQPIPELRDAFWSGPKPTEENIERDLIVKEGFGTLHAIPHREYMTAMYDASLLYLDRQIETLLAYLEASELLQNTIVVVAADHGESLGEHGVYFAHDGLHEPNVRVPLLFFLPGGDHTGRVEEIVENVDIAPTIVDAVGLEIPESFRGQSLLRDAPGENAAFFEQGKLFSGVRVGGLKWIDGRGFAADDRFADSNLRKLRERAPRALYDLEADPNEITNLAPERPSEAEALEKRFSTWATAHDDERRRAAAREIDPEMRQRLQSLGYAE